ncbi:hypothetical protein GCM10011352_06230 [Marinobacterium zhoushanense]|uniref:DUF3549 family protein n=1 Tax=Marinobacterium zhoushanense TaxID=1679163 RepID=A0ABQ1K4K6_9GAMM|nr:DUF3549 family protein [Marinobacterium zhoushanense]GGB83152.1 hypothetical protein GCM10011352_06230 [Marinobacterium zhoushanense]
MSTSTPQPTLIQVLREAGAAFRLFDMGRRVSKLSADNFERLEQAQIPYPSPFLQHAWIGVLIWHPKQREQNAIWFLKLPLDEQGYLVQAARDDLVHRLLQNAVNARQGALEEDALKDNPFAFKPDQEKMAIFHALAAQATGAQASGYFETAQEYINGELPLERWTDLALQGLADLVVRLDDKSIAAALARRIPELPLPALASIATLLEHAVPPTAVRDALAARLERLLPSSDTDPLLVAALIRGLSNIQDETFKQQQVLNVLQSPHALEPEVIVAIASRCTLALQAPEVLLIFLERLAAGKAGQAGFSRVLADLMFMPALRALIMHAFRNPARSDALSSAIGQMFGQSFAGH